MANIEIKLDNEKEILAQIQRLQAGFDNRINLMRRISGTMHSAVMQNFDAGGRPQWLGLKYRAGVPLSDTGHLKNSITEAYDNNNAMVGTNVIYAGIHNFGGVIKPKNGAYLSIPAAGGWRKVKQVTIPKREFLTLTSDDEDDIIDDVQTYFQSLIR